MPSEINGVNSSAVHQATSQRNSAQPQANHARPESTNANPSDTVKLTDTAAKLQKIEARLANVPVVDTAKVEALRQEIASGSYQVDNNELATKILDFETDLSGKQQ